MNKKTLIEELSKQTQLSLKESKNVPHVYEEFGLSQDEFNQQMDLVRQYKAGNTSVLEGAQ